MCGIFVNERGNVPYPWLLVSGYKTIETRSKNMLSALVGKRVAVIRTRRDKKPVVIGYVTITSSSFCKAEDWFKHMEDFERYAHYLINGDQVLVCDDISGNVIAGQTNIVKFFYDTLEYIREDLIDE